MPEKEKAKLIREAILAVVALLAFIYSFQVDDLWFVSFALVTGWSVSLLFAYWLHEISKKWRWIVAIVITILFFSAGFRIRHNVFAKERENVKSNLRFSATMGQNLNDSVVTIHNGGNTPIKFKLFCQVAMLVPTGGQGFMKNSTFLDHLRTGELGIGSDSQSDDCLSDIHIALENLDCVDIKLRLLYSLEDQPSEEEEENHGFIALRRGNKFEWEDRGKKQEKSECERFSKSPPMVDRTTYWAEKVKISNQQIAGSIGIRAEKKIAAQLSAEIMLFGESAKESKPLDPDPLKDDLSSNGEYRKKYNSWAKSSSEMFHERFDARLKNVFKEAKKANIQISETDCMIISSGYPPDPSMTNMCGIAIGWFAAKLPN